MPHAVKQRFYGSTSRPRFLMAATAAVTPPALQQAAPRPMATSACPTTCPAERERFCCIRCSFVINFVDGNRGIIPFNGRNFGLAIGTSSPAPSSFGRGSMEADRWPGGAAATASPSPATTEEDLLRNPLRELPCDCERPPARNLGSTSRRGAAWPSTTLCRHTFASPAAGTGMVKRLLSCTGCLGQAEVRADPAPEVAGTPVELAKLAVRPWCSC